MTVTVRVLGRHEAAVLERVAPDVFDHPVVPELAAEMVADPRHHLAVALDDADSHGEGDGDRVVGMASGVCYVHPDKPAELWVNEVGVAPTHQRRGLGRRLLEALFEAGRAAGCRAAWVLTEGDNEPARALYRQVGGTETERPPVMVEFDLANGNERRGNES